MPKSTPSTGVPEAELKHCRSVVVKDKPNAMRPYRWAVEWLCADEWRLGKSGRAWSLSGAVAKATRAGLVLTSEITRLEFELIAERPRREASEPTLPTPLPPRLLKENQ